jgi:sulfatase modifying factor 1
MVSIPGGAFVMGSDREQPEERSTHIVRVDPFWIDRHEVTNAQFARFVATTHYVTLAERGLDPKMHPGASEDLLAPGSALFVRPTKVDRSGSNAQ